MQMLLGLDIGTSVVKAALFDRAGSELAVASAPTNVASPRPGWSELDGDTLWNVACRVIRAVLARSARPAASVSAVGLSGVMVGAWLIGEHGLLRPGILWNDARTQKMIEAMAARHPGLLSRIFAVSGNVMQQGCTLPLLRWLADAEPHILHHARAVVGAKDFVRWRMTGAIATDVSEAAVAPGSAILRNRSPDLLDLFGLQACAHLLPEPMEGERLAGVVTREAAGATGLPAGTPVAVGAGDVVCSLIGAGALAAGMACTVLGTTCLNGTVRSAPVFTPPDLGLLFTLPDRLWLRTMVNIAGTTNLDWALATLCPDVSAHPDPFAALADLAASVPAGADGVVYVPYLSDVGIIAPEVCATARGGFAGLSPRHRRAHLVRAVFEGVAFAIRDCYDSMAADFRVVRLVGGGARSALWCQLIADVLQRPVEIPEGTESGAKGAALLAGVAIGWFASPVEASRAACQIRDRHQPAAAAYEAAYRRYRAHAAALIAASRALP